MVQFQREKPMGDAVKEPTITPPEYKHAGANWNQQKQIRLMEEQGYTVEETAKALSIIPKVVEAFRVVPAEPVKPAKKKATKKAAPPETDDNDW
jgi:hypothetical protein